MRALILIFGLLAAPCAAQDADLRALTTADATKGWEAVGRLNIAGRAFCTGAMIAPDLVLTAAHCLFDSISGVAVDPSEIQFLAGWRNGRAMAYRGVRRAVTHPDYAFEGPDWAERVKFDLALLQLDQPIRLPSIKPFETDTRPRKGDEVGVVSYARGRSEAPSLQETCRVLARNAGTLVFSCSIDFGSSGAPVFTVHDGVARIVSVISAKSEVNDLQVSLGSAIEQPLEDLRALMAEPAPLPEVTQPRRIGAAGSGGAKFVKP